MTAERSEANIFTINPAGVKVHWKLVEGTPAEELKKLVANVGVLTQALAEKGYTPDPMGRLGSGPTAPASAPEGAAPSSTSPNDAAPRCPDCGGEVYDNRGNRPSPKSPHFKCKSKSCGAVGWLGDNGVSWQKSRQAATPGQRY